MKKKELKKLVLDKKVITTFKLNNIKGGGVSGNCGSSNDYQCPLACA